jgi:hypothetical protein
MRMITMEKNPLGRNCPAAIRPHSEKRKLPAAFVLLGALLAMGGALEPASSPVQTVLSGQARDVLLALAALGVMALGPAVARLAGGPCDSSRIQTGFFRRLSDRPPIGRASGRRGGWRSA